MTDRDRFLEQAGEFTEGLPKLKAGEEPPPRIVNAIEAMREAQEDEARGDAGSIVTGWPTLDTALDQRIRPGELVVLGARTGVGKTWAVQHLIEHAVMVDGACWAILQTLEMPIGQMGKRIAAHVMETSPRRAADRLHELDIDGVVKTHPHLPRFLLCEQGVTVDNLGRVLEWAKESAGDDMTILAVDYFGLLRWDGRQATTTYERVSENAKRLKALVLDYNVVCLAAVQLGRTGGKGGNVEPGLQDLRDSGVIEEASDRIMLLWRAGDDGSEIWLKLAKNRFGPSGKHVLLAYDEARRLYETDPMDLLDPDIVHNPRTGQGIPY